MKTKELIRLLQEADPTGEIECCIDNHDIGWVDKMEAYYDGRLEVLIKDDKGKVIGAKYCTSGEKIKIKYRPIASVFYSDPGLPVDYSDLSPINVEHYERQDNEERIEALAYHAKHLIK